MKLWASSDAEWRCNLGLIHVVPRSTTSGRNLTVSLACLQEVCLCSLSTSIGDAAFLPAMPFRRSLMVGYNLTGDLSEIHLVSGSIHDVAVSLESRAYFQARHNAPIGILFPTFLELSSIGVNQAFCEQSVRSECQFPKFVRDVSTAFFCLQSTSF